MGVNDGFAKRKGVARLFFAFRCSICGLHAGWAEAAFRREAVAGAVLVPAAFWVGQSWFETSLLAGSVLHVLTVELLNTAVERAVDRAGVEWNPRHLPSESGRACGDAHPSRGALE